MKRTLETDIFHNRVKERGKINSKTKGNSNERECGRGLGVWTKEKFNRTPGSGGFRRGKTEAFIGDLSCENPDFKFIFSIETKHLKTISDTDIRQIWKQCLADAIRGEKLPMALLRINRQPKFKHEGVDYIDYIVVLDVMYGGTLVNLKISSIRTVHSEKYNTTLMLFKFSDLVKYVPYEKLKIVVERANYLHKFLKEYGTK